MMITVDPNELLVASETLRSCAAEASDIGSRLSGCACCPMPADLQGVVDQMVVSVDRALDSVAARLNAQSVDLSNRAQIAASDSLAAATAGTTLDGLLPSTMSDGTMVMGGTNSGTWDGGVGGWLGQMAPMGGTNSGAWDGGVGGWGKQMAPMGGPNPGFTSGNLADQWVAGMQATGGIDSGLAKTIDQNISAALALQKENNAAALAQMIASPNPAAQPGSGFSVGLRVTNTLGLGLGFDRRNGIFADPGLFPANFDANPQFNVGLIGP